MNIKAMALLLFCSIGLLGRSVAVGNPGIPSTGVSYTLYEIWQLINSNNPAKTSNFILPTLGGKILTDAQCWPAEGVLLDGSVSASKLNITEAWVTSNKNYKIQLQSDNKLIKYLLKNNRLTKVNDVNALYKQILLYFILPIGGVNYRFYLNDPFPGGIQGNNCPAQQIISKWDFQKAFRPS